MESLLTWLVGGGFLGLIAFVLNATRLQDKKIERAFERLDEIKGAQELTYTRKDVCMVMHNQITSVLDEIKLDVKLLLKGKNHDRD